MTLQEIAPDTADVLLTRSASWISAVTCWVTGMASHQATSYDAANLVEANADDGHIDKVAWADKLAAMDADKTEWILFRWIRPVLTDVLRSAVQRDLDETVQFEKYSYLELPLQAADALLNRCILRRPRQGLDSVVFRRLDTIWSKGVICSETSNRALIKNGFIPGDSGLVYGSPSDTYRWLCHQTLQIFPPVRVAAHSDGWFRHAV